MKCQECGSTDDVKRRMYNRKVFACWNCRKEDVFRRAAQGGADRRPITGDYKDTETVKSGESVGKKGQTSFADFT